MPAWRDVSVRSGAGLGERQGYHQSLAGLDTDPRNTARCHGLGLVLAFGG
jgi:hypothetical protein